MTPSFNTLGGGNEDDDGTVLANNGEEKEPCPRCRRDNHTLEQCMAKRHMDGTMLHMMEDFTDGDANVSTKKLWSMP